MWKVIAEEDMPCTECNHGIGSGTECLSQMPAEMPEHFRRASYENFCIECPECVDGAREPCYVVWLTSGYAKSGMRKEHVRLTAEDTHCSRCDQLIPDRTWTVAQKLYAWPEPESETEIIQTSSGLERGVGAAGPAVAEAARRAHSGSWNNLSPETRRLFQTRGLGRGLGLRTPTMAQRFYERSIPEAIRNQGESAALHFIKGKDASHIRSVSRMPGWARRPSNVVWEFASKNRSRQGKNMSATDLSAVKAAARTSAIRLTAKGVAKGGFFAAAVEAPVAAIENFFHWKRRRKSGRRAATDAAKSTAGAGAIGAVATVATAGVSHGAAAIGISPTLGPAGVPLAVAGAALMVGSTAYRLYRATRHHMPLDEYYLFFCQRNCRIEYAQNLTNPNRSGNWWESLLSLLGSTWRRVTGKESNAT